MEWLERCGKSNSFRARAASAIGRKRTSSSAKFGPSQRQRVGKAALQTEHNPVCRERTQSPLRLA